nr:ATP synthase F0 subunit 8 [Narke japonica]
MPQLNLSPWFLIFIFSWLFFLTIMTQKVMNQMYTKEFTLKSMGKPKPKPWSWPWT